MRPTMNRGVFLKSRKRGGFRKAIHQQGTDPQSISRAESVAARHFYIAKGRRLDQPGASRGAGDYSFNGQVESVSRARPVAPTIGGAHTPRADCIARLIFKARSLLPAARRSVKFRGLHAPIFFALESGRRSE